MDILNIPPPKILIIISPTLQNYFGESFDTQVYLILNKIKLLNKNDINVIKIIIRYLFLFNIKEFENTPNYKGREWTFERPYNIPDLFFYLCISNIEMDEYLEFKNLKKITKEIFKKKYHLRIFSEFKENNFLTTEIINSHFIIQISVCSRKFNYIPIFLIKDQTYKTY